MVPPVPALLLKQLQPHHHRLPLDRAWEIALTWHEALADRVFLMRTGAKCDPSGYIYGAIHFDISMEERHEVSAARAAALVWFALSCCPGYGGSEHPVFWKCVFSEYTRRIHERSSHFGGQSITDAMPFFDSIEFPRFSLRFDSYHNNLRLFCGLPGDNEADTVHSHIVSEIQPWIDHERTLRHPSVLLYGLRDWPLDAADRDHLHQSEHAALARFLKDTAAAASTQWPLQSFTVKELQFSGELITSDAASATNMVQLLRDHDVVIPFLCCNVGSYPWSKRTARRVAALTTSQHAFRDHLAMVVRHVLRLPGTATRSRIPALNLRSLPCVAAFLSALPFTTSVQTVKISCSAEGGVDKRYVAWLAYALFHPDTPSSAWKNLELDAYGFNELDACVLQAMSVGNNLTAVLKDQDPTSDGYYRATLAPGATVLDHRASNPLSKLKAAVLATSDGTLTVEVCSATSTDPREWSKWMAVVVPAYGLGWVLSASVLRVEKRVPAQTALTHLCVVDHSESRQLGSPRLPVLTPLLCRSLLHLDLRECWKQYPPTVDLRQVLASFTSLELLVVVDNGALFNGELLLPLQELVLVLSSSLRPNATLVSMQLPRSLQRLQIDARSYWPQYRHNTAVVREILTNCRDHLRVFHWQEGLRKSFHPTPYTKTCVDSERRLAELGIPPQATVISRLPVSSTAAFLSVLAHYESWQRVDQGITTRILAFAAACVERVVVIEPAGDEIPVDRLRVESLYNGS